MPLAVPAVLNGRIAEPGEVDCWTWRGKKGETYEFELRGAGWVRGWTACSSICDAAGKELARAEAAGAAPVRSVAALHGARPTARIVVEVRDRFR